MKLRFRTQTVSEPFEIDVPDDTSYIMLRFMVEQQTQIPVELIHILGGMPPRPIVADDAVLVSSLFRNNDVLNVIKTVNAASGSFSGQQKRGTTDGKYVPPCDEKGIFVRRVCPGDNSCLFHAAAYVLENKSRTAGPSLRPQVAEVVATHPQKFNKSILGMANEEYAMWIQDPTTWGGAIELSILSFLYQTEIVALDIQSNAMEHFGQGENYTTLAYVVYTGNHFDAMAMTKSSGGVSSMSTPEADDQVLFNPRDSKAHQAALDFVARHRAQAQGGRVQ